MKATIRNFRTVAFFIPSTLPVVYPAQSITADGRFTNHVKSIMTLALTVVFCVLALMGAIGATEFLSIFTMIVGFYFGTQSEKKKAQDTAPMAELIAPLQTGTAVTGNTTPESTMDSIKLPDNE